MRNEQELIELELELDTITAFIIEHGNEKEFKTKDFDFACNVGDAIAWVLGVITTERFKSDAYIDFAKLKAIVSNIETRTGLKLAPADEAPREKTSSEE